MQSRWGETKERKDLAPILIGSTCLMQSKTDTGMWLIQDKFCLEVLSDKSKLEVNSSYRRKVFSLRFFEESRKCISGWWRT